jgi:hypothetical protein
VKIINLDYYIILEEEVIEVSV